MRSWHCFFYYKLVENKTIRNACHATAEDVLEVWQKTHIPTRLRKHVIAKLENTYKEWEKLKKNKKNGAKRSDGLKKKENLWKEDLANIFDIAHADALKLIRTDKIKEFLLEQRSKGRIGKIATLDKASLKKEMLSRKRKEDMEKRKRREDTDLIVREQRVVLMSSDEDEEITNEINNNENGGPSTSGFRKRGPKRAKRTKINI